MKASVLAKYEEEIYLCSTCRDGACGILCPSFEILGVNKLDSHTLASPVAVDNQIFIRTGNFLYCIQK